MRAYATRTAAWWHNEGGVYSDVSLMRDVVTPATMHYLILLQRMLWHITSDIDTYFLCAGVQPPTPALRPQYSHAFTHFATAYATVYHFSYHIYFL